MKWGEGGGVGKSKRKTKQQKWQNAEVVFSVFCVYIINHNSETNIANGQGIEDYRIIP